MRCDKTQSGGIVLSLSGADTSAWARGDLPKGKDKFWPGSTISGRSLFAEFDSRGDLVDMNLDDGKGDQDPPAHEFNAITSDFIRVEFPDHPCLRS
jgi:hypothetical protein